METPILIKEFLCQLYGYRNIADIDEMRYRIFEAKRKPTNCKNTEFLKTVDPMVFPPGQKVLHLHMKRAWYISKLYKSASDAYPSIDVEPIFHGWKLSSCKNFLEIDWFHSDQVPQAIEDDAGSVAESDAGDTQQKENIDSNVSDTDVTEEEQSEDEDENFDPEWSFRNSNFHFNR